MCTFQRKAKAVGTWLRHTDLIVYCVLSHSILFAENQRRATRWTNFNRCFSVHFDKYKTIFTNKCTVYYNIKCYNLYLKYLFIWLLHVSVPHGPPSGSIRWSLAKVTVSLKSSLKTHH